MTSEKQAQDKTRRVRMQARAASPARASSLSDEAILPRPIPHRAVAHALHSTALQVPPSQPIQARKDASSFGVLVLIGVAAAFRATFLPHMTKPSVASKLAEANPPVALALAASALAKPAAGVAVAASALPLYSSSPPSPSPPPPSQPPVRTMPASNHHVG